MATINKNQGESITIDVILGESIELTNVNEIVVSLGDNLLAKYSSEELIQNNNTFTWRIKSDDTRLLLGIKDVIVSIDLDGYGNRKTAQSTSPKINFLRSDNPYNNTSESTIFTDLSINIEVVQDNLVANEVIMNVYQGLSNYQLAIQNGVFEGTEEEYASWINAKEISASTSATNAENSAIDAYNAKVAAESARDTAITNASQSSTNANNAATANTNAQNAKTSAETAASTATTKASQAATSETNATNAKTAAESARDIAITKASEASTSATNAATSATNAATANTNAQTAATTATTKASEAAASAATAANLTNTKQINDLDNTAYVIEDNQGKIALKILNDGTVVGKFDISKIKLLFSNMPDNIISTTPDIFDSNFSDYAYVITDTQNKIVLAIGKDGKLKANFDLSLAKINRANLDSSLQSSVMEFIENGEFTGYQYAIIDNSNKVAFGIDNNGYLVGKIKFAVNSVGLLNLKTEVTDYFLPNSLDFIPYENDGQLINTTQVEISARTSYVGTLFERFPPSKTGGILIKNDTGTALQVAKNTPFVKGENYIGTYTPLSSATLITNKGYFKSSAVSLPSSPSTGDYYQFTNLNNSSSPVTIGGVSLSQWDILYWNGTSWLTYSFPFANTAKDGDFVVIQSSGKILDFSVIAGNIIVFQGMRGSLVYEPLIDKLTKDGELYYLGELTISQFGALGTVNNNSCYIASETGTYGSFSVTAGDFLVKEYSTWTHYQSEIVEIPNGTNKFVKCNNSQEISIRRTDKSTTQVVTKGYVQLTQKASKPQKTLNLVSDSMFLYVAPFIQTTITDRTSNIYAYKSATSEQIFSSTKLNAKTIADFTKNLTVFWHGQNNVSDFPQIKRISQQAYQLLNLGGEIVFWSVQGQMSFTWNGIRLVDTIHETAFANTGSYYELEQWYDTVFPNRVFHPRRVVLQFAENNPSLQFPGMTERQVADTYGIPPSSCHIDIPNMYSLNFVGYYSSAGLPTGGSDNDYYIRTANGVIGNIVYKSAGTWIEYDYDGIHNRNYSCQKLADYFKTFLNTIKL